MAASVLFEVNIQCPYALYQYPTKFASWIIGCQFIRWLSVRSLLLPCRPCCKPITESRFRFKSVRHSVRISDTRANLFSIWVHNDGCFTVKLRLISVSAVYSWRMSSEPYDGWDSIFTDCHEFYVFLHNASFVVVSAREMTSSPSSARPGDLLRLRTKLRLWKVLFLDFNLHSQWYHRICWNQVTLRTAARLCQWPWAGRASCISLDLF